MPANPYLIRVSTDEQRLQLLDYLRREKKLKSKLQRMIIDVDPVSLL